MNDRYEIEIGANINDFKKAMREIQLEVAEKKKILADLQKENKYNTVGSQAFTTYTNQINDLKDEITDAESVLSDMTDTTDDAGTNMSKAFKNATKTGSKFLLSLFSIRTVWSLVSKGANTYLQENEKLNESVKLTSSLLGNTLGPIIKEVVSIAQYGMIVVSELIRLFTGYDAVAETITNSNKEIAKSGKVASKSMAGFDTLQTLSSSSGAGGLGNIANQTSALDDFKKKAEEVRQIFEKYEEPIKIATTALGLLFGANMLAKITKIIGSVSAGTGLAGASSLLGTLAGYAITGISIAVAITIIKDEIDKTKKDLKDISGGVHEYNKEVIKDNKELNTILTSQNRARKSGNELLGYNNDLLYKITGLDKSALASAINIAKESGLWLNNLKEIEKKSTFTKTQHEQILDNAIQQYAYNTRLLKNLGPTHEKYAEIKSINDQYLQRIIDERNELGLSNDKIEEMYSNYKHVGYQTEEISADIEKIEKTNIQDKKFKIEADTTNADSKTKTLIDKIIQIVAGDWKAVINVDANTSKAKSKLSTILGGTVGKLVSSSIFGIPATTIANWLNSFDVGTNYVPNDQLAMVHKGEMIIPAKYNPVTSGIMNNGEVVYKLDRLINVLENKEFNAYLDGNKITDRVISGINSKNRIMGGSVIK